MFVLRKRPGLLPNRGRGSAKKQSHPAKIDLDKKWLLKQKIIQNFNIDAQGFRKTRNENSPTREIGVTSKPVLADLPLVGQVGWHGIAGNSYFQHGRTFMSCFSEPLGINIEILNVLLIW